MDFYAHSSRISEDRNSWQHLRDHLDAVSDRAKRQGQKIGCGNASALAGQVHDLGKYTVEYLARLDGATASVDHSTAGAWHVLQDLPEGPDRLMAELVAYCVSGHHAGMPDMFGGSSSLDERLSRYADNLDPSWKTEVVMERAGLLPPFEFKGHDKTSSRAFRFAMLGRYIFSCLVDADYRDTEAYYDMINGHSRDRDFAPLQSLLPSMLTSLERHMASLKNKNDNVNAARTEIFKEIRSKAHLKPGLFTMNVPTGGGKTLSSLAFALDHALIHGMDRIIYGIPFTSVIDQTASIFRNILGDDNVLEHHSAIGQEGENMTSGASKLRLAMEDWSAPVVVTTNVQFFESLMTSKPSRARKIHNIARSIIILDEAQTIPRRLLIPCAVILDELARNYGCTIILCTATQPAFNERKLPLGHPLALPVNGRELAPDPAGMGKRLRRVRIVHAGEMSDSDLIASIRNEHQALVIVNSRKHALKLYMEAISAGVDGIFHLSTRQTAFDRKRILEVVKRRLNDGKPCKVISTSLIEAGVDIDFPKVWRCEAGLDQIAQAAGRCNREGTRPVEDSIVTIFSSPEFEPPFEIRGLIQDMRQTISKFGDPLSPEAIENYFLETYWRVGIGGLDSEGIMNLFKMSPVQTDFSYRTASKKFKFVETKSKSVIVAESDEARKVIAEIADPGVRAIDLMRRIQTHIVQIPKKDFDRLLKSGAIEAVAVELRGEEFMRLKDETKYLPECGFLWEPSVE